MKIISRLGYLALIAAVGGGSFVGCSGPEANGSSRANEPLPSSVALALQPVAGVTINSVHYVVTKSGVVAPILEGDLPTLGTAATFNVGLPIPTGGFYTLSLSGVSVESAAITCTGSVGPFNVSPNHTTQLSTTFACTDANKGALDNHVLVTTDSCPRLIVDYLVVTPNAANVGSSMGTFSKATDLDGRPVSYAWTIADTSVGSFAAATSANTSLLCQGGGNNVELTLTASNGQCSKLLRTAVTCTNVECGDGLVGSFELCDPSAPGSPPCRSNCTPIVCGDGILDLPLEQCDPVQPDPTNCKPNCQIRKECGDGFLSAGEACDGTLFPPGTPVGNVCTPSCQFVIPGPCGDGITGPGEVCDPKLTVNDCGRDCKSITSPACLACDNLTDCVDFVDCFQLSGVAVAGSPAAGTPKAQLCNEVLDCVRDSGCAAGGNAIVKCYCGTANVSDCQNGLANGVCKTELEKGLETTAFAQIVQRLRHPGYGGGIAMSRVDCEQQVCAAQCGLN